MTPFRQQLSNIQTELGYEWVRKITGHLRDKTIRARMTGSLPTQGKGWAVRDVYVDRVLFRGDFDKDPIIIDDKSDHWRLDWTTLRLKEEEDE